LETIITDLLCVGAGLAGERVAVEAASAGFDALCLSIVPPRRSHSSAAQGGMQAALGNCFKGDGDCPDVHFTGHGQGLRLGLRPGSGAPLCGDRTHRRAGDGLLGNPLEPGGAGKIHLFQRRQAVRKDRARGQTGTHHGPGFRRHRQMAHLLHLRRHRPHPVVHHGQQGGGAGGEGARPGGGHFA
jgi:hypothetical protein